MSESSKIVHKLPVAFITGATGFIGSHLARCLVREGWAVHILTRTGSRFPDMPEFSQMTNHVHDGSTESMVHCVAQAKPDVVFHLASWVLSAHGIQDIEPLLASNVLLGSQLLEAMKVNEVRNIVNTGTFWQHYNNEEYNPVCLYAATKQAFEAILEYYVRACDFKAITLQLFDTYGPGDLRPKLFHLLNKAATTGVTLDMSAGEQLIDLVHIDDVIDAYLIAAQRLLSEKISSHERYSVSSENPLPLKKLVHLYAVVTRQTINVNWGGRAYRYREVMLPWNRGELLSGWKQKISLTDGIYTIKSS